ncbi:VCBS repeat-containing protein [Phaeodactylibacter luteus]|uniref:VCBS repeat-containing protein n=1 Tax=Phaeodactylibacter luteus TaxID=1564516 RepID=A0A5C6S185_9BACT|nr:VCBS repeat-containing protein [Phaeodactylibacter luteus]TXB67640.1 VCBS repeat-containing protein [Phaeodactylibacter luteus]
MKHSPPLFARATPARILWRSSLACILAMSACSAEQPSTLFTALSPDETGVSFANNLYYTEAYNPYTYRNFYNGGGVALGDINNDGLIDIYFAGNLGPNKLYLNKGNLQFEDITEQAGVACEGVWTSGVSFVDLNGDGLLDIYACKAGKPGGPNRHNELFINQGDLTFSEQSKDYGLDITGLSIQAAFFDYDLDGDLDCYLLNNSLRSVGGFDMQEGLRDQYDPEGNKLLENRNGKFVDVTQQAGIYSSSIGYGLGITLADFDQDGYPDIFLSNDFFEKDYLYFNNQDGTFSERSDSSFYSLSMGSMGADACDLDNDLLSEIFVTEMLPRSLDRKKTKAVYEEWDKYKLSVSKGYHHQFSRNVLHKNYNGAQFAELGRLAGVESTDWSWSALMQDYDGDGLRDIFVSNGIRSDLLDKDYLNYMANEVQVRAMMAEDEEVLKKLIEIMPSSPVPNAIFKNEGELRFSYKTPEWGLAAPTFSNGSAYGDLDNDGDLDLVVNNVDQPATIYRNNSSREDAHSISVALEYQGQNTKAIGAKVLLYAGALKSLFEYYPAKGFQSCSAVPVFFGLGREEQVDSLFVIWPNGEVSARRGLAAGQQYTIRYAEGTEAGRPALRQPQAAVLTPTAPPVIFEHEEVSLNLFGRERMLLSMPGGKGPVLRTADVNGDGKADFFAGGGKNQPSRLYLAMDGGFEEALVFEQARRSEVTDARFFDSDQDGDLDLYVAHGGKAFSIYAPELHDILYLNDGQGHFTPAPEAFPFPYPLSTGAAAVADLNNDGRLDVAVGEAMKVNTYGLPGKCLIWLNQGGNRFALAEGPPQEEMGMITAMACGDWDNNGWADILLAGEYMPLTVLYNEQGTFRRESLKDTDGLWNTAETVDLDGDGDMDVVLGNLGENNFFGEGLTVFVADFDHNGTIEQLACRAAPEGHFPVHDIDELYKQMPVLRKKYRTYEGFSKAPLEALIPGEDLAQAGRLYLKERRSVVLWNEAGQFRLEPLPRTAQYSSVHAILAEDIDQDGITDLLLGGNDYRYKPQFGRQDASRGCFCKGQRTAEGVRFPKCINLEIDGQVRTIARIGSNKIVVGINNGKIQWYEMD